MWDYLVYYIPWLSHSQMPLRIDSQTPKNSKHKSFLRLCCRNFRKYNYHAVLCIQGHIHFQWLIIPDLKMIWASLSEPHIDKFAVEFVYCRADIMKLKDS